VRLLNCLLFFASASVFAGDALAPTSNAADALVSPLKRITISTNTLAESKLFYVDAMGMQLEGPLQLKPKQREYHRRAWQLERNNPWQLYRLHRPGASGHIAEIELVVFERSLPAIQSSWSPLTLGPLSIGFPNADQVKQDQRVRRLGFGTLNSLESYSVPRPDGSSYRIDETIFNAPDFTHAVGIHRGNDMAQLGALDQNGLGGPAYVAQVVEDSTPMIAFMQQVLDWEMRSDRQWKSAGSKGALNVPDGTEFRFSILYAKGASSGHVLLIDYQNIDAQKLTNPARVGNRGVGMWTLETKDLAAVKQRAKVFGARYFELSNANRPAIVLTAPNGFQILLEQMGVESFAKAKQIAP
jgi:hypothetical protein